jgi:hypothetical protein
LHHDSLPFGIQPEAGILGACWLDFNSSRVETATADASAERLQFSLANQCQEFVIAGRMKRPVFVAGTSALIVVAELGIHEAFVFANFVATIKAVDCDWDCQLPVLSINRDFFTS